MSCVIMSRIGSGLGNYGCRYKSTPSKGREFDTTQHSKESIANLVNAQFCIITVQRLIATKSSQIKHCCPYICENRLKTNCILGKANATRPLVRFLLPRRYETLRFKNNDWQIAVGNQIPLPSPSLPFPT